MQIQNKFKTMEVLTGRIWVQEWTGPKHQNNRNCRGNQYRTSHSGQREIPGILQPKKNHREGRMAHQRSQWEATKIRLGNHPSNPLRIHRRLMWIIHLARYWETKEKESMVNWIQQGHWSSRTRIRMPMQNLVLMVKWKGTGHQLEDMANTGRDKRTQIKSQALMLWTARPKSLEWAKILLERPFKCLLAPRMLQKPCKGTSRSSYQLDNSGSIPQGREIK